MARWMVAAKKADFDEIAAKYHISPVLARIMRNRDVVGDEEIEKYLYGDIKDLHDPLLLKDLKKAAEIIMEKIRGGKKIRIIGDYDVDGICAAYILLMGIQALGGTVDTVIPHRQKDGYGLNEHLIEAAGTDGIDTIITCDNGIAASPQIQLAKDMGMTVVVTDHHEVPFEEGTAGDGDRGRVYLLPEADAVVDPKQPECGYPFKQICGAVVAMKLVQVLLSMKEPEGGKSRQEILDEMLTFGALATVCDVMELRDENRILVKKGLALMRETRNPGLRALLMVNGIEEKELTPYHAGFIIGPCLNATGRLDTAKRALELFDAEEWKEAVTIAGDLKCLNDSRKQMTEDGVLEAVSVVENTDIRRDRVLVIYLPDCHESLAGIIAGRIREKYGKPVFVLTRAEEGVKGSGRSVEAYHMYDKMSECKELFTKYGGHKMAAGLSLPEENVEAFRVYLNAHSGLREEDLTEVVHIDVPMPMSYVTTTLISQFSLLEPFGNGNPKPVFAQKEVRVCRGQILGKNKNVGKYRVSDGSGHEFDMMYFGDLDGWHSFLAAHFGEEEVRRLYGGDGSAIVVSVIYYPDINVFRGREQLQMIMQDYSA